MAVWRKEGEVIRWLILLLAAVFLTGCEYTEVVREIGYKGKARVNPWLAAERFCEEMGYDVRSALVWSPPDEDDSVWFVPASVFGNESFTRQADAWVGNGGHLILLLENADSQSNDWSANSPDLKLSDPLLHLLQRRGIHLKEAQDRDGEITAGKVKFQKTTFNVEAESGATVAVWKGDPGVFASTKAGWGRLSVVTDASMFRNRRIDEKDHAKLLDSLIAVTGRDGNIVFMRGSALSLWTLAGEHLWPVLLALALLVGLWLWKNFSRFGPIEAAEGPSVLRGFDHHLEALGDFQWRHDKAAGLLAPLRAQIVEYGQRASSRSGRRDEDFFQFLADRAGISRERVFRALGEAAPADAAILTRTVGDLQRLLQVLH
jgi:hypothetical protein